MAQIAIIYARFSSAEQSKGYSLERQQKHGLLYATDNGWSVEKTITDEGRSAFTGANRLQGSAFHEFELEARNGLHRGKVLLVENVDRLSRQGAKAAAKLIWALNEQGVDVATWQDGYVYKAGNDGDLMELFSVIIKAQMAFEESEKKSKRTSATWEKRFEQIADGTHKGPMPNTPKWIDYDQDKGFVLNRERTAVLNQIFDLYIDGMGIHRIVTILHKQKTPSWTPPDQQRGNNGWFYSYIYRLLTKRAVLGEYVTSDGKTIATDYYPQAITAEKWNRAQAALSLRKGNQRNVKIFGNRNLLSRMVFCEKCGGGAHFGHTTNTMQKYTKVSGEVVSYRRKTYRKLRCDRARRNHSCDNDAILNYDVVEATILEEMLPKLVRRPDTDDEATKLAGQLAELARLQGAEQGKLDNLIDVLAESGSKAILQRVAVVEAELDRLNAEIAAVQKAVDVETATPAVGDDIALIESLKADLTSENEEVRIYTRGRVNMGLRRLINRIVITEVGNFRVEPDDNSWFEFDEQGTLLEGFQIIGPSV
jgi:DNA invertase Pin-like site-specific DNA recombinase